MREGLLVFAVMLLFAGCVSVSVEETVYKDGTAEIRMGVNISQLLDLQESMNKSFDRAKVLSEIQREWETECNLNETMQGGMNIGAKELDKYPKVCEAKGEVLYIIYKNVDINSLETQKFQTQEDLFTKHYILTLKKIENADKMANLLKVDYIVKMPGEIKEASAGKIVDNTVKLTLGDFENDVVIKSKEWLVERIALAAIVVLVVILAIFKLRK